MTSFLFISTVLLWIFLILNLLLSIALVRKINALSAGSESTSSFQAGLAPGERAPDFSIETLDGEPVTLATYAGRSVAFIAVSPQCEPCKAILPELEELAPKAARAGVELVLVSNGTPQATRALAEEFSLSLPILVSPGIDNAFSADYKLKGTPSYCLVDASGLVVSSGHPSRQWGAWKKLTEQWERGKVGHSTR